MTSKKLARQSMTRELVTIRMDDTMENAYQRMLKRDLRHLPVCDDQGEIVGMLSNRDVQRSMISQVTHGRIGHGASETIAFDPDARVRDYMGWPVLTVDQNADLRRVAEKMHAEKVSALLVQEGGDAVGIITSDDLLRVLIDLLGDPRTPTHWNTRSVLDDAAHRYDEI